ncbi:MAG: hypothetical protein CVV58_01240 [Tenericutes bacterium HGW-Tenericutes-3]|jgi:copper chaperone CopZ|nr:MAG: hypothetical protein CVV58_01240 [Tenericutes bacterium HGW-Tenericutes-3]
MNKVRLVVKLTGIRCAGCLNSIDRILTILDAEKFEYDFYSTIGSFYFKGEIEDEITYLKAIEKTGYGVMKLSSYIDKLED